MLDKKHQLSKNPITKYPFERLPEKFSNRNHKKKTTEFNRPLGDLGFMQVQGRAVTLENACQSCQRATLLPADLGVYLRPSDPHSAELCPAAERVDTDDRAAEGRTGRHIGDGCRAQHMGRDGHHTRG